VSGVTINSQTGGNGVQMKKKEPFKVMAGNNNRHQWSWNPVGNAEKMASTAANIKMTTHCGVQSS
jgi:hypothetical protein